MISNLFLIDNKWEIVSSLNIEPNPQYEVAFLLPPHITLPNNSGISIGELVKALAGSTFYKAVVFSNKPKGGIKYSYSLDDVAYYLKDLKESFWDKGPIFARIKGHIITPTKYAWRQYAFDAADACIKLGVKCLVVEDVADFVWAVRQVREHGIKVLLHQHAFTQRNYNSYLWRRIEGQADKIIFVAQNTLNMTKDKYGKLQASADVIYNGVDLEHYDPNKWLERALLLRRKFSISNDERVLTFIGRLAYSKGIIEALKGFLKLGRKDIHFFIIGGIEESDSNLILQELTTVIDQLCGNECSVHHLFNIPQSELPCYYSIADFLVVPSNNNYEGLPKVVTEALAMGVPVIASDRGGMWELLEEGRNGWKINDPISPDSVHDAMVKALNLNDEELCLMKQRILEEDRPKMDQQRMVKLFDDELSRLIDQ